MLSSRWQTNLATLIKNNLIILFRTKFHSYSKLLVTSSKWVYLLNCEYNCSVQWVQYNGKSGPIKKKIKITNCAIFFNKMLRSKNWVQLSLVLQILQNTLIIWILPGYHLSCIRQYVMCQLELLMNILRNFLPSSRAALRLTSKLFKKILATAR